MGGEHIALAVTLSLLLLSLAGAIYMLSKVR